MVKQASRKTANSEVAATAPINWPLVNKITSLVFIFSLLLWGYMELTDSDRFTFDHVKITGEYPHVLPAEIQALVTPHAQRGFFNLSLRNLQTELEALPWVMSAEVKRKWPDTLIVNIVEHEAYCKWNDAAIIATDNTVFAPPKNTISKDLPALRGPEGTAQIVLSMFEQLSQQLQPLQIKIASLTLDNYYTWQLTLDNGLAVNLGREDVVARVGKFVKAYPKVFAGRASDVEYIDMRYQHGMAVKWR